MINNYYGIKIMLIYYNNHHIMTFEFKLTERQESRVTFSTARGFDPVHLNRDTDDLLFLLPFGVASLFLNLE